MAIQAAIVSEYWQPHDNAREMWEYGGDIYTLGIYRQGPELNGLGMFRTNGTALGEPSMTNGGVTWEEVNIAGSPRKSWSMASGQNPYNLIYYVADRFGDIIYFACQCLSGTTYRIQVGSFNLATGLWGVQGTDTAANPSVISPNTLSVTDMKMYAAGSYMILYREASAPGDHVKIVKYAAGAWGTPLTVVSNDPTLFNTLVNFPRLAHSQSSLYAQLAWIQELGISGNLAPNDAIYALRVCTYTIAAGTVGAIASVDTSNFGQHNTASQSPRSMSYFHNFGSDSFIEYRWDYGTLSTDFDYRYAKATPVNSSAPAWTSGAISTTRYEYDENQRFVTVAGVLLYVHTIGQDNTQVAPFVNASPQIASRAWSGSAWATTDTAYYTIATGNVWPGRTTNDLPVPGSATSENYDPGGNPFGLHAIGTFSGHRGSNWQMPLLASSIGGTPGFVALVVGYWERLSAANATATYFFREPTAAPPPAGAATNVMFFGVVGI